MSAVRVTLLLAGTLAAASCLGLFSAQAEVAQSRPMRGTVLADVLSPCKQACSKAFDNCTAARNPDGYCASQLTNCENSCPKSQ